MASDATLMAGEAERLAVRIALNAVRSTEVALLLLVQLSSDRAAEREA
jgi:hypothetical protein